MASSKPRKMPNKTIEYEGKRFTYDPTALKKYSVQRSLAKAQREGDQYAAFEVMDQLFLGKTDEYAEQLGDDMDKVQALFERICVITGDAKN